MPTRQPKPIVVDGIELSPAEAQAHLQKTRAAALQAQKERDELLSHVLQTQGEAGLEDIFPWRLVIDIPDTLEWLSPSCTIRVEADPVWAAVMSKLGCSRRGQRTWALPVGKKANRDALLGALRSVPTRITYMHQRVEKLQKRGEHPHGSSAMYEVPWELRNNTELGERIGHGLHQAFGYAHAYDVPEAPERYGAISVNSNGKELFFTVTTVKTDSEGLFLYEGGPNLNLWPLADTRDGVDVLPAHAIATMAVAQSSGIEVVAPQELIDASETLSNSIVASRVAGAPGEVSLIIGASLADETRLQLEPLADDVGWLRTWRGSSEEAHILLERCRPVADITVVDDAVVDAMNIATAEPVDVVDRPYQQLAIARHLATGIGYINASPVGSGKTPMALIGMGEWAQREPGYRGLVTCGSSVVGQWASEAHRFTPNLHVTTMNSANAADVIAALPDADDAQLIICSHDTARRWADEIASVTWNDMVVDEAQLLKNPSSGRSKAMWAIRQSATRAVGLTGTPIDRSLDDLGAILAWVFYDKSLFYGEKLSRRFSVVTRERLWDALGAYVFRPDPAEVASQMPQLDTHVERITVHPSELKLAQAAHDQLAQAHERMLEGLSEQAHVATGEGRDLILQARSELAHARGAIASGVILARLATADPSALSDSESAGAMLLERDGLVKPALKHATKRTRVAQLVAERTVEGIGVLIFTDFSSVATRLVDTLTASGVKAEALLGSHSAAQRTTKQHRFQGTPCPEHTTGVYAVAGCHRCVQPEIEALVLTGAGREGLNLQRAGSVVMYDLPWVPSHVIQRIGRAQRIGGNDRVEVVVPLVEGTIEERVASVLIPRIAQALATLDPSVSVGQSLMGFDELAQTLQGTEMDTLRELAGLPALVSVDDITLHVPQGAPVVEPSSEPQSIVGEHVALTGTLAAPRHAWAQALSAAGASLSATVTDQTTLVVAGLRPGIKADRASNRNIPIISETVALSRLGEHVPEIPPEIVL